MNGLTVIFPNLGEHDSAGAMLSFNSYLSVCVIHRMLIALSDLQIVSHESQDKYEQLEMPDTTWCLRA